ncbi:hypothetical protein WMY93_009896 [Mugilogobius chulae]|uniref:Uncharacterized protein n=1 Tax=Mugilogobius chulae TaxID=88201 RepID=A0AAW0P9I9_9GOBI
MEPEHKELLEKFYPNLVEDCSEADRLVDTLVQSGALAQSEGFEVGHNCSSNSEKVDLLLKILLRKERDYFSEFCTALEAINPHLHALLVSGTGPVDHTTGSTYSVLSTMPSDSESSSSLSSLGTPATASSPPPVLLDSPLVVSEKIETVLFQLRQVTRERDELRKRLALSSPGTTCDDCRPNSKTGHDYERLKLQCMKAMADLQSLQNQHSSTLKRCEEAVKKADFYHTLHSRIVSEHAQMKDELELIRQDNIQLVREHNHVKQACDELRRLHEDDQREVADMRMLHQQVRLHSAGAIEGHGSVQRAAEEMERLQSETTRLKTQQLKALKDCDKYKEERDSVMCEYRLIMSERDQVIKEVDRLQTGLDAAQAKLKNSSSERRVANESWSAQTETRLCDSGHGASKQRDRHLRKQYEAISQELKDALQEAEVAKCRRDWAFQERDKIVAERESIRTLCDNLRRERDRAVSDLADALRNLDDTRKQKNDSARELKEIKEKMENQLEKEARFHQLMAHSSHDSAIDTDSIEWETEVVELEKQRDMDLKALGFDIAEGVNDPYLPGDCGVFVSKVDKGSIAEGRLRVNDWLLKVNDVDLTNKDRKQVIKAVLSGEGVLNMVVRRRKSLGGRVITPVQINMAGSKESGIGLESGVFVATLAPGSPAAREGALTVGDRLLAINGITLDNKSLSECEALLRNCRDALSVSLVKIFPQSCSGQSLLFESEKPAPRLQACDVHSRNCRNSKHSPKSGCANNESCTCEQTNNSGGNNSYSNSLHSRSLSHQIAPVSPHSPSETNPDYCYRRQDVPHRPAIPNLPKSHQISTLHKRTTTSFSSAKRRTWPKVMVGASIPECTHLSIFKKPKQRKSIFDIAAFRRPDTVPKLDYLSLSHAPKHSPQNSISETPPTPPTRSDSFRFKHRQQNSSVSDGVEGEAEGAGKQFYSEKAGEGKSVGEEEGGRHRAETQAQRVRRYRPKSAPASRRNVTPLHIPVTMQVQSFSNDEHSPEPTDMLRFSPMRNNRYSMPFSAPNYNTISGHPAQRGLSPCSAVTAVMRNPVYTAWSHEIQNNNCSSSNNNNTHTSHSHTSPQHQGRLSLDLSHKRSGDMSESSSASHNSNSLPSSSRTAGASSGQFKRIKIPPVRYPRSTGSDRGSLSHSECSSPTPPMSPVHLDTSSFSSSQSQSSISPQPRISVSPAPLCDKRKDGPYLEEPRNVTVQKGAEPLGISIVSGENGGVFVSKVTAGSIAHQARLEYGDQLLEFNGINLRNANEQQARLVIGQQCDTVTILAQYNPHMFQLGNHSRSGSRMESISNQPTPLDSAATTPDHLSSQRI